MEFEFPPPPPLPLSPPPTRLLSVFAEEEDGDEEVMSPGMEKGECCC